MTGINERGDGGILRLLMSVGGVDESGGNVDTCRLVGKYQLTKYLDDTEYSRMRAHFPELNILQPAYTMIEFDETVADDANVSNLDNETGYKYGNTYVPSGHIKSYLASRHRVLAKVTKKATQRNVKMGGVDTIMNNLDGVMTYYPLHDSNSNYYADAEDVRDCSPAKLDGSEGDIMMLEPHHWFKGINDYLNRKHYICFSTNVEQPLTPEDTVVVKLEDIKKDAASYLDNNKLTANKPSLKESYTADNTYAVMRVAVGGYKKVRFPTVPSTGMICSLFVGEDSGILKTITIPTINLAFEPGMYLISDVPEGAKYLYFTVNRQILGDDVVLSNSDRIEDMEPEWVEEDAYLCGVVGSTAVGEKLRACVSGGSTTANMPWSDFHYYSVNRGMQQIDFSMSSHIANLFYMTYGRRDSQTQCGAGSHTNTRTTGGTMQRGMKDTIGFAEAKGINPNVTDSISNEGVRQYAWYKEYGLDDAVTVTQVNNTCCLGYEDIYGHKYDMMDNCDIPNDAKHQYMVRIFMPDSTERYIKVSNYDNSWIANVYNGKYGDVIAIGSATGSASTYYCDKIYINSGANRVLCRGGGNANALAGVASTNAAGDASGAAAHIGSCLAFRGKVVKAASVASYKAATEVS